MIAVLPDRVGDLSRGIVGSHPAMHALVAERAKQILFLGYLDLVADAEARDERLTGQTRLYCGVDCRRRMDEANTPAPRSRLLTARQVSCSGSSIAATSCLNCRGSGSIRRPKRL